MTIFTTQILRTWFCGYGLPEGYVQKSFSLQKAFRRVLKLNCWKCVLCFSLDSDCLTFSFFSVMGTCWLNFQVPSRAWSSLQGRSWKKPRLWWYTTTRAYLDSLPLILREMQINLLCLCAVEYIPYKFTNIYPYIHINGHIFAICTYIFLHCKLK